MDRNRPSVEYEEDGWLTVRASALGGCLEGLAWLARGGEPTPPPPFVQEAMDLSASLEQQAMDLVADQHLKGLKVTVPEAGGYTGPTWTITGGTDFMVEDEFMVEVKVMGAASMSVLLYQMTDLPWRKRSGLAEKYTWQLAAYQLIHDRPISLVVVEKDRYGLSGQATIIATDRMDLPGWNDVMARMNKLTELVDRVELRCEKGDSGWCPAQGLCQVEPVELDLDLEVTLVHVLTEKVKASEQELRQAKDELQSKVQEVGGRVITPKGVKLTWVETHVVEKKPREYDRKYLKITPPKDK